MEGFSATHRTRMKKGVFLMNVRLDDVKRNDQQWPVDDRTRRKGTRNCDASCVSVSRDTTNTKVVCVL